MNPRQVLEAFDSHLAVTSLRLDAVVIGGTALNLLGVVSRPTKDCDILHPELAPEVAIAARAFAIVLRKRGEVLQDDWLNNGPASLAATLPSGWQDRVQLVFSGVAIELHCLGRHDLLMSKLFALCDRGIDLADCVALAPKQEELRLVLPWLEHQDGNPGWKDHVRLTFTDLAKRLGHGL